MTLGRHVSDNGFFCDNYVTIVRRAWQVLPNRRRVLAPLVAVESKLLNAAAATDVTYHAQYLKKMKLDNNIGHQAMPGSRIVDVDIAEGSPQGSQREIHVDNDDLQSLQEQLAEFEEENAVLNMENQMLEAFYESVAHEIGEELRRQAELHSNDGLAGKKKAPKKEKKDEGSQTLSIEQKQRCAQMVFESNAKLLDRTKADREKVRFGVISC